MNTPKGGVSWLESFPPDIWAYFAWYLPGEQLGRLMMTGARFLWHRLKSPNVVRSINLGQDFLVFKSFPMFLNEFPSLDELSIYSCHGDWCHKLGMRFDEIPSGLRKLELRGNWKSFNLRLLGRASNISKHLPRLEILNLHPLNILDETLATLSSQSLTKLSIHSWHGRVDLPSSLIHFSAVNVALAKPSAISKLPPSLETFTTAWLSGIDLLVPLLPATIRELSFGERADSYGPWYSQIILGQLPKFLTSLQVPYPLYFEGNPELMARLPSTLTELTIIPNLPYFLWPLLPPHLTKLSLWEVATESNGESEVLPIPFDTLPRSLTSLELCGELFCGPPAGPNLAYFPPQLTRLQIELIQLSPSAAKLLPASLTHLEIGNLGQRVCEHLPKGLKTLISRLALITPALIKFLPTSLTFLQFKIPTLREDSWFDDDTGIETRDISTLPEYPFHELCVSKKFDWKVTSPLPPTICYLKISRWEGIGNSFLLNQQLPNLIELSLNDSCVITDRSIPLLSPHLRILNLESAAKVSGKSFRFLPRNLTILNLASSKSISDSHIRHLPRTLKEFYFGDADQLTDSCVPDLPPHLEILSIWARNITPSCFSNLPLALRSSQAYQTILFPNWSITRGVVYHMP